MLTNPGAGGDELVVEDSDKVLSFPARLRRARQSQSGGRRNVELLIAKRVHRLKRPGYAGGPRAASKVRFIGAPSDAIRCAHIELIVCRLQSKSASGSVALSSKLYSLQQPPGDVRPVPTTDEIRLLERHLPKGWTIRDELAAMTLQPEEKQREALRRLEIIDGFLDPRSGRAGQVESACCEIGLGRRQFYHLLAKLRQHGPTKGLTPGYRNVARRSVAVEGLAEPLDAQVRAMLAADPMTRISAVEAAIRTRCDAEQLTFPGESAIRRRVHALKRMLPAEGQRREVGEKLTIDQVHLDISVESSERRFALITLIVDHGTRIILGHAVTDGYSHGMGLYLAVRDFDKRLRDFQEQGLFGVERIADLTWIVSRDLEVYAWGLIPDALGERTPRVNVIGSGPRRHGSAILRIIGDRLPPFTFKPMAMERIEASSKRPGLPLDEVRRLVANSVNQWNNKLSSILPPSNLSRMRVDFNLVRLQSDLAIIFEPIFRLQKEENETFGRRLSDPLLRTG